MSVQFTGPNSRLSLDMLRWSPSKKISMRRHDNFLARAVVAETGGDIIFYQRFVIDVDLAGVDTNAVAGNPNDALDEALLRSRG